VEAVMAFLLLKSNASGRSDKGFYKICELRKGESKMTKEQMGKLMDEEDLGYACVYFKEDNGMHTDFVFPMTAKNIANFIGKYAFEANKIIMTDLCDSFICESVYGGFLMNCPEQELCREIIPYLSAIQQGEEEPEEFPVATSEEMDAFYEDEEEMDMREEVQQM